MGYVRIGRTNIPNHVALRSSGFMFVNRHLIDAMDLDYAVPGYGSVLVDEKAHEVMVEFVLEQEKDEYTSQTLRRVTQIPNGWLVNMRHLYRIYSQNPQKHRARALVGAGWLCFNLGFVREDSEPTQRRRALGLVK